MIEKTEDMNKLGLNMFCAKINKKAVRAGHALKRPRLFWFFIFLQVSFGLANPAWCAVDRQERVVLKKSKPFAVQVREPGKVYVIKKSFDLGGGRIVIPEGCELRFKGGSVRNGELVGNSTIVSIKRKKKPPFGIGLKLDGSFIGVINSSSYQDDSIQEGLVCLLKTFEKVVLDKDYVITQSITIDKSNVNLDGNGHVLYVRNLDEIALLRVLNTNNVSIENLTIDFSHLKDVSYNGESFEGLDINSVEKSVIRNIVIKNVNSSSFRSAKSFFGIRVRRLDAGFTTEIDSVWVENVHVLGNGKIGDNYGGASAVTVECNKERAGSAIIRNVTVRDMIDVDTFGNEIAEDISAIHINAHYYDNGVLRFGSLPTTIKDCSFEDVSKRLIKLQAKDVVVSGITCAQTKDVYCYSAIQSFAGKTIIRNCRGRYNGEFIRVSEQSKEVLVEDIDVESNYNKVFPHCFKSFMAVSAPDALVTMRNIKADLDGGRLITVWNNLKLDASNVEAQASSLFYSLADVSSYNGSISFKDSQITITGDFGIGKDSRFPLIISHSVFDFHNLNYQGFVTLNDSEMHVGTDTAQGNLLYFRGGLRAANSAIIDHKTLGRVSHNNMVVVEGDSFIDNVVFTTTGTVYSNCIIATTPKTTSFSIYRSTCSDSDMSIVVRREIPTVVIENMDRLRLIALGHGNPNLKTRGVSFTRNDLAN